MTNADIIHDAQCAAQALKARRAVAANVAKKKTFQSVIVDNKVEVARAAGKVKAMAARDGIGFCPNFARPPSRAKQRSLPLRAVRQL